MTFHDVLYNNKNKKKNSESGNVKACSLHRTPDETEAMRSEQKKGRCGENILIYLNCIFFTKK